LIVLYKTLNGVSMVERDFTKCNMFLD